MLSYYYVNPTYDKWLVKTNRNYPSPEIVRSEIWKSAKGVISVTLSPTLALYLAKIDYGSKAYCGLEKGWEHELGQFFLLFLLVDFYEWGYHYCGHTFDRLWNIHKPHHRYHNPTPWAVIADDAPDEIVRGAPLFIIPMLMPVNLELLFLQFILVFNFYGTLIHTGIDYEYLPIHGQKWLNTPYHHHIHHALSIKNKPMHTGFVLQVWDQMMGSIYKGEKCYCSACDAKAGNRTLEHFEKIEKPDYSVLWSFSYWWNWVEDEAKSAD